MRAGAIVAEGASRTFRVHPERSLTLKEALLRRGRLDTREIRALDDVSFSVEPGESVALVGRNGSGKTTLLRLIAGIFKPTSGRVEVGGSVGALLALGAGFHQDFTGRENVFLAGSILGLGRDYIREQLDEIVAFAELDGFVDLPVRTYSAGMNVRLGFAVATHLKPDVLLLDEVFAVGDEAFQRKCVAKIFELKEHGGTIVFVSHDAGAVERLCERAILLRAGRLEYDGRVSEAIARYHRMLAVEEAPAEREAGLREWGTREVRIASLRVEDAAGAERDQFLGGEALTVRLELAAERDVPPPALTMEVRDDRGGLVGAGLADAAALGWEPGTRAHVARFSIERLPLADGRFRLAVAVADASGGRLYHRIEDATEFVVFPDRDDSRGRVRLDGRWSLEPAGASLEAGAR